MMIDWRRVRGRQAGLWLVLAAVVATGGEANSAPRVGEMLRSGALTPVASASEVAVEVGAFKERAYDTFDPCDARWNSLIAAYDDADTLLSVAAQNASSVDEASLLGLADRMQQVALEASRTCDGARTSLAALGDGISSAWSDDIRKASQAALNALIRTAEIRIRCGELLNDMLRNVYDDRDNTGLMAELDTLIEEMQSEQLAGAFGLELAYHLARKEAGLPD